MECNNNDEIAKTKWWTILIAVGCILLVIPIVSLLVDSQYLLMIYRTRISTGSEMYELLSHEKAGPLVYVYVFNITNAEAFLSGEDRKLRVEEVGPFTYQEYRKNEELKIDEEAGVMRYRPMTRTKFLRELSIDDPEIVNVTVPNAALLAMAATITSYPYWANDGFNELINRLGSKSVIYTNVHNYLWGYDDPLVTMFHDMLGWITFSKMGVMDRLYDQSNPPLLEVSVANVDKFQVKRIDGYTGLIERGYEYRSKRTRCNSLVDTYEGVGYPPRLRRGNQLRLYRSTFCRMLDLNYIGATITNISSEAFIYEISNKSYSIDTNTECLCRDENKCIDGITDISPCLFGLSIALSNGHFLYADPKIYERIEGMHPNKDEHGSEFVIERNIGAVISSRYTLQANVIVKDISYNPQVKPFSGMVVPLVYLKIVSQLSEEDKYNIRMSNYVLPYVIHPFEVILFIIALLLLAYSVYQMSFHCHNIRL